MRASPDDLRDLAVLVVDDNATNRHILVEMLGCWGMRPTAVESGPAALAEMERAVSAGSPYPLVLLDGHMPEMDGFTLARQIVQRPALSGATLMMLSSGERPDAAVCEEMRLAGYLTKPLKQSDLLEAILATLRLRGEPAPLPPAATPSTGSRKRKLRILLAEDNNVNQRLACHLLGTQGHEVIVVGDGKQAVARIEREAFDLVLMDVQMPEMDGLEATTRIREREKAGGRPSAHRGHDRIRHEGRSRTLSPGGHGRLHRQTDSVAGTVSDHPDIERGADGHRSAAEPTERFRRRD